MMYDAFPTPPQGERLAPAQERLIQSARQVLDLEQIVPRRQIDEQLPAQTNEVYRYLGRLSQLSGANELPPLSLFKRKPLLRRTAREVGLRPIKSNERLLRIWTSGIYISQQVLHDLSSDFSVEASLYMYAAASARGDSWQISEMLWAVDLLSPIHDEDQLVTLQAEIDKVLIQYRD